MAGLKAKPRPVKGRCGCLPVSSNLRRQHARARSFQLTGDAWAEDPACYLSDGEIGVTASNRQA